MSRNTINADENSIYRALNRLADFGDSRQRGDPLRDRPQPALFLPDQPRARELLTRFITRNILVFEQPDVADLIQKTLSSNGNQKG